MSENLPSLLVVGGGNMGSALVAGVRQRSPMTRVLVLETDPARHATLLARGAEVTADAARARAWAIERDREDIAHGAAAMVVLAVKPQSLASASAGVGGLFERAESPRVAVSILAGVSAARVGAALGPGARVVRAMPNLPASIGQGITAIAEPKGPDDAEGIAARRRAETLLACVGQTVRLPEALLDAFTAVAGSGPAYLFLLAEAMEHAAERVGIDGAAARAIVRATIRGSAALLGDGDDSPETLRRRVTSPGGTTEAALKVLAAGGFAEAVARAVEAARDRGRALDA